MRSVTRTESKSKAYARLVKLASFHVRYTYQRDSSENNEAGAALYLEGARLAKANRISGVKPKEAAWDAYHHFAIAMGCHLDPGRDSVIVRLSPKRALHFAEMAMMVVAEFKLAEDGDTEALATARVGIEAGKVLLKKAYGSGIGRISRDDGKSWTELLRGGQKQAVLGDLQRTLIEVNTVLMRIWQRYQARRGAEFILGALRD